MVLDAQQTFRTERVFAGIIVIGLVGFLTDLGFRLLRRRMMPWYRETEGSPGTRVQRCSDASVGRSKIGASRPLRRIPAIVSFLNA